MGISGKLFFLAMMFCGTAVYAQTYQLTDGGIKSVVGSTDVELKFYDASTVRVLKSPQGKVFEKKSLAVVEEPEKVRLSVKGNGSDVRLRTSAMEVVFNTPTISS